jgi:hypothetical protein
VRQILLFVLTAVAVTAVGILLVIDYRGVSAKFKARADAARQSGGIRGMFGPDSGDPRKVGWMVVLGGLFMLFAAVFGKRH